MRAEGNQASAATQLGLNKDRPETAIETDTTGEFDKEISSKRLGAQFSERSQVWRPRFGVFVFPDSLKAGLLTC
jgi:hypothetical protein